MTPFGSRRPSRRRRAALIGLLLGCLVATLVACGGTEIDPPKASPDPADTREGEARDLLARMRSGLRGTDRAALARLAAPDRASRSAMRAVSENYRAIGIRDLRLRWVAPSSTELPEAMLGQYGGDGFAATVSTTYRISDYDTAPTRVDARFLFADTPDGVRFVGVGGGEDPGALWLTEGLRVEKTADTLVMAAPGRGRRVAALTRQAVIAVRRVLPRWRGALVVEIPRSQRQLEELLNTKKDRYRAIAAVTTTVDGKQERGTPVHVFVNPRVFDRLGARGAQVVLSHEATHVATGATFATMPTWLLEGFADYVALARAGIPFSTAARQILERVRTKGPPTRLPTKADLDPAAGSLGATYEEAWTACYAIGSRYGESKMVAFYHAVEDGASTQEAFRRVLGTTQRDFVRSWSRDLAQRAG